MYMLRVTRVCSIAPKASSTLRATFFTKVTPTLVTIPFSHQVLWSGRTFASYTMGSILPANIAIQGDLNNTSALRNVANIVPDPAYSFRSLALTEAEDDATIRENYRPFILSPHITSNDWISKLELSTATRLAEEDIRKTGERLKVLVLYGSLRQRYVIYLK